LTEKKQQLAPSQSNDEGAKGQKRAILASLKRAGPDVPFILSKIVAWWKTRGRGHGVRGPGVWKTRATIFFRQNTNSPH